MLDVSVSPLPCTVFPKQNGRVAIVTGGAKGMGYETARCLTSLGMHVIIGMVYTPLTVRLPFATDSLRFESLLQLSLLVHLYLKQTLSF